MVPGMVVSGIVGAAGLLLGLAHALAGWPARHGRAVRVLGWVLVATSVVLTLLAADPPVDTAEHPCLQVHQCVIQPRIGPPAPPAGE